MIDAAVLLANTRKLADRLVDDLRERTESHDESRIHVQGVYSQATAAGRTDRAFEEWREDLLAQVAAGWVLGCVFVRFCEDNGLYDTPLLSGPGDRRRLAGDHRAAFFADDPTADDRDWLREVFGRYAKLPGTSGIFGERNPLWQLSPGPDGAKALVELWWATDDEGRVLRHDFSDASLDTRFLGDLYQDLSEHARKQYALLQTPEFVEEFILDRTLDPAIETFGLAKTKMIDPTCGSGHFLLGAFDRLLERWQQTEPGTDVRELAQRVLDSVNGVDINPFAVAIARFRLLVAALRASDIRRLVDAPDFRLNVAAGDSLLHGTRPGALFSGAAAYSGVLDHHYPTEDADDAERLLQAELYQAVVGNPPYIAVPDKAPRDAYRALYDAAQGHYTLVAPFLQRFFELAGRSDGRVGLIVGNGYLRREFGRYAVEAVHRHVTIDLVVDSSLVDIDGHGTDTVILCGRPGRKNTHQVRLVTLDERTPLPATSADLWRELVASCDVDRLGRGVSSATTDHSILESHPVRLLDGAERALLRRLSGRQTLASQVEDAGKGDIVGQDDLFVMLPNDARRHGLDQVRDFVRGDVIRDWVAHSTEVALFPFVDGRLKPNARSHRFLWPWRRLLQGRRTFSGKSYLDEGRAWAGWHQVSHKRLAPHVRRVCYPQVETSNHFVALRPGVLANQSIRLLVVAEELATPLVGLLNSSVACWWMRATFAKKHSDRERWTEFYEFDAAKMASYPLPNELPHPNLVNRLIESDVEWAERVAMQEELDWACYHLYGLTHEELVFPIDELPRLQKGERAFEIALARRMAAGEATSTWFDRHGSTPITELPEHWPAGYCQLVDRRLELIGSDRAIGLLERPEYKRRWNWAELPELEQEAQRAWLLDRLEGLLSAGYPNEPEVTTVARLADELQSVDEARAVLEDLAGAQADPVKVVGELVDSGGVPYLAAMRLKESGLRTRHAWERTWTLQRIEDDLDARAALPADHPDHLDASALVVAKKEAEVDKIPVPPKYKAPDFRDPTSWRLRGKLDVPKERFILYPRTHLGADTSAVVGWAGWDHLEQLQALAGLYTSRKHDGAEGGELTPMLAGMAELLPWVLQWHDDPDVHGFRMGQESTGFLDSERAGLGLTADDLTAWRP